MKLKYWIIGFVAIGFVLVTGFDFQVSSFSKNPLLQIQPAQAQLLISQENKERNPQPDKLVPAKLQRDFQLRLYNTAVIDSENLEIKFIKVIDSRCPANVQCIWQGQVFVAVNISKNGQNLGDFDLISRDGSPELAVKSFEGNSTINLVDVKPKQRVSTSDMKQLDYVVTLRVSKT